MLGRESRKIDQLSSVNIYLPPRDKSCVSVHSTRSAHLHMYMCACTYIRAHCAHVRRVLQFHDRLYESAVFSICYRSKPLSTPPVWKQLAIRFGGTFCTFNSRGKARSPIPGVHDRPKGSDGAMRTFPRNSAFRCAVTITAVQWILWIAADSFRGITVCLARSLSGYIDRPNVQSIAIPWRFARFSQHLFLSGNFPSRSCPFSQSNLLSIGL